MVNINIKHTGFTQVSSITSQLSAFANRTDVPNKAIIDKTLRFAKDNVKVDTGALRDAIYGRYGRKNAGIYINTPDHKDGRKRPYHLWRHGYGVYGGTMKTRDAILPKAVVYMKSKIKEEYDKELRRAIQNR